MANVKISELATSTTITAGDYLPCVEGGVTKKVQAGPGGGLDADTVSGYGIGTAAYLLPGIVDADTIYKGGNYYFYSGSGTHTHFPRASGTEASGVLIVAAESSMAVVQTCIYYYGTTLTEMWIRSSAGGVFTEWATIWTNKNDGNGGKLPCGKGGVPITTASLAQNAYATFTCAYPAQYLVTARYNPTGSMVASLIWLDAVANIYEIELKTDIGNIDIVVSGTDVRITNKNASSSALSYTVTYL